MRWSNRYVYPVVAAVALTGSCWFGASLIAPRHLQAEGPVKVTPDQNAIAAANDLSKAFRTVHAAIKDTVVNIDVTKKIAAGRPAVPDDLRRVLPPGFEFNAPDSPAGRVAKGTGSGVIVSADGYILTNNHVVEDSDDITVRFDDGKILQAKIVGTDPKSDLAVIKLDAKNLPFAGFGDSDALDVGDWVLAFGSPFGFDQTMTQGIISAKGRQVNIIGMNRPDLRGLTYENFLQTDAAINPGNSGGPLVNLKGEVIGLNTAIASRSGAYNGIGFAIPSNDARYILDSLIKNGKVIRGYMGVSIVDVHEPLIRSEIEKYGFTGKNGVLVKGFQPDSPAAKGGLQLGDIITQINGKNVETIQQLRSTIARTAPATKITLSVVRDGKTVEVAFPVAKQPDSFAAAEEKPPVAPAKFDAADLGISVREIDAATAQKYGLKSPTGVLITKLDPNGLGVEAGLQLGDIVTKIGATSISTSKDFTDALGKMDLAKGTRIYLRSADGSDRLVFVIRN